MQDATMVHRAMLVMTRCKSRDAGDNETMWTMFGPVRLAFYPTSRTHRWFGKHDPISSREAMRLLKQHIGGSLS